MTSIQSHHMWTGHVLWQDYIRAECRVQRTIWPKNYNFLVGVRQPTSGHVLIAIGITLEGTCIWFFLGVQSVVQRFAHQKEPECVGVGWRAHQFIDVRRFTTATSAQLLAHDWLEGVRPARLQRHREALRLLQPQGATTQWSGFESLQLASARTALTAVCVCMWTGSRWRHTVHVWFQWAWFQTINDQSIWLFESYYRCLYLYPDSKQKWPIRTLAGQLAEIFLFIEFFFLRIEVVFWRINSFWKYI